MRNAIALAYGKSLMAGDAAPATKAHRVASKMMEKNSAGAEVVRNENGKVVMQIVFYL